MLKRYARNYALRGKPRSAPGLIGFFDTYVRLLGPRTDPRRRVKDPVVLKAFIDAVAAGDVSNLSAAHRDLAARIYKEYGKKPSSNGVMSALSSLRKHEWAGIKKSTLQDNYYRPHCGGAIAPRTQRARKRG